MRNYVQQLLSDISIAAESLQQSFLENELELHDWITDEEEDKTAPIRDLEEWTGIRKEMLPPAEMLSDEELQQLLEALKKMLDAANWSFVLQTQVPDRIQYYAIRDNYDQKIKLKRWHMGFFDYCHEGTEHKRCALGDFCQCALFAELFSGFDDDELLSPEEQRKRQLDIEIQHIKRKYEDDWMKYYPYHLDANYDDEDGNPYNYGFDDDEEDEDDNWWRR